MSNGQQRQKRESYAADQPQPQQGSQPPATFAPPATERRRDWNTKSGFQLGDEKRTAGQAGESNISFEWIEEWIGGSRSARFTVKTSAGNGLEVTVHQESYHRPYSGVGTVTTGLVPVAPIGTKGRVVCVDTGTGETLEKPWVWQNMGAGKGFWQLIKSLFWKG